MEIRTLHGVEQVELLDVFNRAFESYFVPLQLNEHQLKHKLAVDCFDPSLSAGAFDGEKLVGFILHGIDIFRDSLTAYNSGTGVLPEYRGRRIVQQLYEYNLPSLGAAGIKKCILEVIDRNTAAIHSYEKCGFHRKRELVCYKAHEINGSGKSILIGGHTGLIRQIEEAGREAFGNARWMDWKPAWQNSDRSITQMGNAISTAGSFVNEDLVGYITYNSRSAGVLQFAVRKDMRCRGIGTSLFQYAAETCKKGISMINIDNGDTTTNQFLDSLGFDAFLMQYEMELNIG